MNSPTLNKGVFIQPNISLEPSLHSFLEKKAKNTRSSYIESPTEFLIEKSKTLIVAEPGFGKSRLLKELIKLASNDYECGFFDLKKSDSDIIAYIEKCISDTDKKDDILNEKLVYYHSPNFKLKNNAKTIICLDALDEVKHDLFSKTVKGIEKFIDKFSNVKLFISCRTHHVEREKADLKRFDFDVAEIYAFSSWKTVEYLKQVCPSLSNTDEKVLLSKLSGRNTLSYWGNNNVLSTPRYLEIFAKIIENEDIEKALQYDRYELFDKFIIEKLRKEEEESSKNGFGYIRKIYYVKQALERLALILEIQRANEISKDDFVTFMLDTNLNLDSQLLLEIFYDRTILKDNGDSVEFENTEFQEYLAAKAISRFSRSEQIVFDVAVEQKLDDIYENWFSVLSYLVEIEPDLLLPIIKYAIRIKNPNHFILIKYPNHKHFEDNEKSEIFEQIFSFFVNEVRFFGSSGLDSILGRYFIKNSNYQLLLDSVKGGYNVNTYILRANAANLLQELFAGHKYENIFSGNELSEWKIKLMDYSNPKKLPLLDKGGDAMHRYSIYALTQICQSVDELNDIKSMYGEYGSTMDSAIVGLYREIDANHEDSIDLFFQNIDSFSVSPAGFSKINSKKGFTNFFKILLNNNQKIKRNAFRKSYTDTFMEKMGSTDNFYSNLENNWSKRINDYVVESIVYSIGKHYNENYFIENLTEILNRKNDDATFQVLNKLFSNEKALRTCLWRGEYFGTMLKEHQVSKFVDIIEDKFPGKNMAFSTLENSSNSKISELTKKYFPQAYEQRYGEIERAKKKQKYDIDLRREKREKQRYEKFKKCLSKGHHHVVVDYLKDQDFFDKRFSDSKRLKFKNVVKNILKECDPLESELTKKGTTTTFSNYSYGYVIQLIKKFEINIEPYRQKILYSLLYDYHTVNEIIFEVIPNPTEEEINNLLEIYKSEREDDLLKSVYPLIKMCEKYTPQTANIILRGIIENKNSKTNEITYAIDVLNSLGVDIYYLKELYKVYVEEYETEVGKKEDMHAEKLKCIVPILIRNGDGEALAWLIQNILTNKKLSSNGPHRNGISHYESDGRDEGKNLYEVRHIQLKNQMLVLLAKSCELINKDGLYYEYFANAVWSPITEYFINLKSERHLIKSHLQEIHDTLSPFIGTKSYKWFQGHFDKIRENYIKELSQPDKISDAIKKYNELKAKKYIDISTPMELYDIIKKVITRDLAYWITNEGANKVITKFDSQTRERAIQDYIAPKLQYYLMKEGLRDSDISVKIYKEAQTTGDDRIDLLITYGLVGSILLELKREENKDLTPKNRVEYINKVKQYMKAVYANYCILLVFKDNPDFHKRMKFEKFLKNNNEIYRNEPNIEVLGINCIVKEVIKK